MDEASQTGALRRRTRKRWWLWLLGVLSGVALALLLAGFAKYNYLRAHADTMLRDRLIATLSARFHSPVRLDSLHLDTSNGVHVTGTGLTISYLAGPTQPDVKAIAPEPMVSVASFEFQTNFKELFQPTTRIVTVFVKGLQLHVPPHGMRRGKEQPDDPKRIGQPKISLIFDKIVCVDSRVVVETSSPGKLPLIFNIASVTLTDVGAKKPLVYDASLTNPKPVGDVHAAGRFGPWQADEPRDTPIDGDYSFTHADLSTFKGIAGILTSTGHFDGMLGKIAVIGITDTPDFRLDISDHPVALHTNFRAEVDGTNGDTTLKQVDATLLHSVIHASGSVYRVGNAATGVIGHDTELSVLMDHGRIEDLLTLGTKTNPPIMSGAMTMRQRLSLPPGKERVATKMKLAGTFTIQGATFGNPAMQQKINELSMRAQGHPKQANAQNADLAKSSMTGTFAQASGIVNVSSLHYEVPGATLELRGRYTLEGNSFDFKGVVRTDATASQMTTGWKSMLLKAVDPLLKKNGAGLEVPITISGTKAAPKFGVDMDKIFH